MYYVYILICKNNIQYVGCTRNLQERITRHKNGCVITTRNILPVTLHAYFAFKTKYIAYNFEKYLKSGSGRAFANKHFFDTKK